MKRAMKQKSTLYAYLNDIKVLETGTEQDIERARKEYWRNYRVQWRKKYRADTVQLLVILTKEEIQIVAGCARKHKRSKSAFIKEACFAYVSKQYLFPDKEALLKIHQLLAMNYQIIMKLWDENIITYKIGTELANKYAELERSVMAILNNPKEISPSPKTEQ